MSLGKKDLFPIQDEANRANRRGMEHNETPLLLNPCVDRPEEFLEFVEHEALLQPTTTRGLRKQRALESIRVYGLNRPGLVLNRQEYLRIIELRIYSINALAKLLQDYSADAGDIPTNVETVIDDLLFRELAELARACQPQAPFSLMVKQEVERHLAGFVDFAPAE